MSKLNFKVVGLGVASLGLAIALAYQAWKTEPNGIDGELAIYELNHKANHGYEEQKTKADSPFLYEYKQGFRSANYILGLEHDIEEVKKPELWVKYGEVVKQKAEAGSPYFMEVAGLMYEYGKPFEQSNTKAMEFYSRAYEASETKDGYLAAKIGALKAADGKHDEAFAWYEKGFEARYVQSAIMAFDLEVDSEKKLGLLDDCATYENKTCLRMMGQIFYDRGEKEKAHEYLLKASKWRDPDAMMMAGIMYLKGDGVELDAPRGILMLDQIKSSGSGVGEYALGMYFSNNGEPEDMNLAEAHFENGAKLGHLGCLEWVRSKYEGRADKEIFLRELDKFSKMNG